MRLVDGAPLWRAYNDVHPGYPGWTIVGVYPSADERAELGDEGSHSLLAAFAYTVGLSPTEDVWCSAVSVEGETLDPNTVATVLNRLAYGIVTRQLHAGDCVELPVDSEGCLGQFWIGEPELNDKRRLTNMTSAQIIWPILFSDPHAGRKLLVQSGEAPIGQTITIPPPEGAPGAPRIDIHLSVSPHRITLVQERSASHGPLPGDWLAACDCGWHSGWNGSGTEVVERYAAHLKEASQ